MMVDIGSVVFASVGMALLMAGLGGLFPASHRPWWHALRRAEPTGRALPAAQAGTVADPSATVTEVPAQPAVVPLTVIESVDRRTKPLPFVGKDRRKTARAAGSNDVRRRGNGH